MVSVACAIIIKNKKVLVTQRGKDMQLPFKWEFPGGKVKNTESEEECILREIKEELSVEIRVIKKLENVQFHYDFISIKLIPFLAELINGSISLIEHNQAMWVAKDELMFLDWAPADLPIVNELLQSEYV